MAHLRSDLGERLQNKGSTVHLGMRKDQIGIVQDETVPRVVLVEKQVQINDAWTFWRDICCTLATHGFFNRQQPAKKLERTETGFEQCSRVHKAWLIGIANWRRVVEG